MKSSKGARYRPIEGSQWCHDEWRLFESSTFTNGEKVVIGWMAANVDRDQKLVVPHAHSFIARAVNVSRSTVTRTLFKLEKMGAAEQVGEMRIQLRHPRRMSASSVTHNKKEGSAYGASNSTSDPASQATQKKIAEMVAKYGPDWRKYRQCDYCGARDVPLRHKGEKYLADIDKLLPTFDCRSCAEKVSPTVASASELNGNTGLRPGASLSPAARAGEEEVG